MASKSKNVLSPFSVHWQQFLKNNRYKPGNNLFRTIQHYPAYYLFSVKKSFKWITRFSGNRQFFCWENSPLFRKYINKTTVSFHGAVVDISFYQVCFTLGWQKDSDKQRNRKANRQTDTRRLTDRLKDSRNDGQTGWLTAVAYPDLELRGRGGGGLDFLVLLAFFPTVISSFFTQNRGAAPRAHPLDPPLDWLTHWQTEIQTYRQSDGRT